MIRRRSLLAAPALLVSGAWAQPAVPPEVAAELPGARLQGQGRLTFLLMHVYDARLWAAAPLRDGHEGAPLALELIYARTLYGRLIAERSITEMQRVGTVTPAQAERWLAALTGLFPDVHKGDRITGVQRPGEATRFFVNARRVGEVRDAEFTRLFFGIWLSPRSSEPALRDALLGER